MYFILIATACQIAIFFTGFYDIVPSSPRQELDGVVRDISTCNCSFVR